MAVVRTGQDRWSLAICISARYNFNVIVSFAHKGLGRFFAGGSKAGIQPKHTARLRLMLTRLDDARGPRDMDAPGWRIHPLKGDLAGHWAVWVDENWRLTFRFEGEDALSVDYRDYHKR